MRFLVEKVFDIWEMRVHTDHDTPAPGCYDEYETSKKVLATSSTMASAEWYRKRLIKKYLSQGWRDTINSTKKQARLMDNGASNEIYLWVAGRIVSEIPTR